jgi:1,4-dihydroxy-2-naphthoate octaprenyltransferase
LTAAIVPVLVGTAAAIADGGFAAVPAAAALAGAILIQIGTNFANDYFDAVKGADQERTGPTRVTQAGLVSRARMRLAIAIAFALALLCGIYLATVGGWPIVVIGILSILSGLAYTGGPYPLGYHGLGDLFVFVFFGLIATAGTYYVQAHRLALPCVLLAVPVGFLTVAILVANNLRDIESDRRAGKRTLVARFGRRFGRIEYLLLVLGAFAVPSLMVLFRTLPVAGLLPLLALPIAFPLLRLVFEDRLPLAGEFAKPRNLAADLVWDLVCLGLVL